MQKLRFLTLVTVFVLAYPGAATATVYNLTPSSNWYGIISGSGLNPGDEVILQSGVYSTSSWLPVEHQGTAANPIIIRAADGANPIITKTTSAQNNMDIRGARHLIIRGLEFTGADTAIRIQKNAAGDHAKFVTIEDCHIHHTGGNAITANHAYQTYEGMIFRGNEIHHTGGHGEAFYLGSNNDAAGNTVSVFYNGLIEKNYIHDLVGGTISQGDGIEIKDGSYGNIVRDNVIFNTNYPGIIVYGTDGNAPNIIERNVVIGTNDNGIQAASEAIVRNNIIMGAGANGIGSHHHQSAIPGNLDILHNTIIADPGHDTVHIYLAEPASGPILVANNALYNGGSGGIYVPGGTILGGNVVSHNLGADFGDVANLDFFPIPGSAVIGAGSVVYVVADDFNGTPRGGVADAGAYLYDPSGNPGWEIAQGFKVIPVPPGDANVDGCVDGLDYVVWSNNYQTGTTWKQANFNGDGITDGLDYVIWSNNFSMGCPAASPGAVPEPTSLLLLPLGVLFLHRRRQGP